MEDTIANAIKNAIIDEEVASSTDIAATVGGFDLFIQILCAQLAIFFEPENDQFAQGEFPLSSVRNTTKPSLDSTIRAAFNNA